MIGLLGDPLFWLCVLPGLLPGAHAQSRIKRKMTGAVCRWKVCTKMMIRTYQVYVGSGPGQTRTSEILSAVSAVTEDGNIFSGLI
jgi:hypothetical protein